MAIAQRLTTADTASNAEDSDSGFDWVASIRRVADLLRTEPALAPSADLKPTPREFRRRIAVLNELQARLDPMLRAQARTKVPTVSDAPIDRALIRALEQGEGLRVVYQPVHDLLTRRIVSAEALVRWRHPVFGDISPAVMIPAVHRLHLGGELLAFVQSQVIRQLTALNARRLAVPIAINASSNVLCAPGLARSLATSLREASLPASLLKIEMTEDVETPSLPHLEGAMVELRCARLNLSLDDFGSGHSTPQLLSHLAFDELKVDASLVRRLMTCELSRAFVKETIEFGRVFGIQVVAEGIQDQASASLLYAMGCDRGQGFLFSRPMEGDRFRELLSEG
ncbi:EAL domain-containing protein [Mitsuaria sp. GD03876]|uniref:EAL domain-containing protein n=1 Tax=Mitsuaria sp. GD03876 TaxID=2975399 RepID=UPI002447F4C9|nr:EAL domain-containing protein [Mitsuaria sp. GD03876]MDH0865831.1 EAL domain-containing protein [Mitsuaria sp. GD03876]